MDYRLRSVARLPWRGFLQLEEHGIVIRSHGGKRGADLLVIEARERSSSLCTLYFAADVFGNGGSFFFSVYAGDASPWGLFKGSMS